MLLCTLGGVAAHAGELPADLGQRLVNGYIAPATQGFADAATQLADRLQNWCTQPADATSDAKSDAKSDATARAALQQDFANLVERWSGIEFLRFGPLVAANRFERIFFWPDARGVMVRQVQALLAGPAEVATNAQTLATRSVAVQGLPALEYVLYRDGGLLTPSPDGAQRSDAFTTQCAYAQATAHNLAERGRELATAWRGDYAALFTRPGSDNPLYRSQREVANEAIKAISTSLQFVRDVKLAPALAGDPDTQGAVASARRAPFWRSHLTARSVHAQVHGLQAFYQAGGWRYRAREAWIDEHFTQELARAQTALAELPAAPLADLLASADPHRQLQLVTLQLGNAKRIVEEDLAAAFGITIGFNALDGD